MDKPSQDRSPEAKQTSSEDDVPLWLDVLPPVLADKLNALSVQEIRTLEETVEIVHGPLPAHMVAREFEQILPGSAERILTDVLEGSRHDREFEKAVVLSEIASERVARTFLFLTQVVGLVVSGVLGFWAISSSSVGGLVLSGAIALASMGGPTIVKLIVEKISAKLASASTDKE